jgi:hypothetical protein
MVLPSDGGIHRVGNPYSEGAVSVHLYGPRTGGVDGRDYDPSREYVCDRLEDRIDELGGVAARSRRLCNHNVRYVRQFLFGDFGVRVAGAQDLTLRAGCPGTERLVTYDV